MPTSIIESQTWLLVMAAVLLGSGIVGRDLLFTC